eukprot:748375-Hanusia_phi.AAC.3
MAAACVLPQLRCFRCTRTFSARTGAAAGARWWTACSLLSGSPWARRATSGSRFQLARSPPPASTSAQLRRHLAAAVPSGSRSIPPSPLCPTGCVSPQCRPPGSACRARRSHCGTTSTALEPPACSSPHAWRQQRTEAPWWTSPSPASSPPATRGRSCSLSRSPAHSGTGCSLAPRSHAERRCRGLLPWLPGSTASSLPARSPALPSQGLTGPGTELPPGHPGRGSSGRCSSSA